MSAAPAWYDALSDVAPLRAATEPIAFHASTSAFFGTGMGIQPSHETLLRESIGIPALAERAIAQRVSQLNPLVKTSARDAAGTLVDETLDDHPLKALLDRPHPNITRSQLLRLTSQYVTSVGEAYWLKVGSRLGVPVELHPIPPWLVTPILVTGVVEAYGVKDGNGGTQTLPADVIVRFYFPDPQDPWRSEGYLGPAALTADSLKFSSQHLRQHYQNDATPKTALEAGMDAVAFSKDERTRFYADWTNSYNTRTGDHQGAPAITPSGYKLIELALQSGADITPLLSLWQDEMLMNYGVPKSVLGKVESGDRSSAETNAFVFDLHAITPIANLIDQGITLQLAPDFDDNIFVEFEEFVSADKVFQLEQEKSDLLGKVRSINLVRQDRALDPVDWGEEPVGQIGQAPYRPNEVDDLPDDDPEAFEEPEASAAEEAEDEEPEEEERSAGARAAYFSKRSAWQRQIVLEKKYVPGYAKRFREVFTAQSLSVENNVADAMAESLPADVIVRFYERARAHDVDLSNVFSPEAWERLFKFKLEPIRTEVYQDAGQLTLDGFGPQRFIFTEEQAELLREQGAKLVQQVNQTTLVRLQRTLAEAVEAGESIDQMVRRIRAVMVGKAGRARARTIARTEVLKASQTAQLEGFKQSGVVSKKRWNTSLDGVVRDTHATVEGQVVANDRNFVLGDGEAAQAPGVGAGGKSLSAANSINCRCFVTPVLGG